MYTVLKKVLKGAAEELAPLISRSPPSKEFFQVETTSPVLILSVADHKQDRFPLGRGVGRVNVKKAKLFIHLNCTVHVELVYELIFIER